MRQMRSSRVGTLMLGLFLMAVSRVSAQQPVAMRTPAPEFKGIDQWINTKPLSLKDLKGKVVVVHFWTFG